MFDVQCVTAALRSEASDGTLDVKAMAARLGAMGYRVKVRVCGELRPVST